jgi:subfamily B ATP-binding cassette protein MsbA
MRSAQKEVQDDLAEMSALSQEALIGSRVIKAFSAQDKMGELYGGLVEKQLSSQIFAIRRFAQLRPMVELIGAGSLSIVLLICGFMAKEGLLQISQIVALTFALDTINQGAKSIANVNSTYNQVQAAAERIYTEVLDVAEEDLGKGQGRRLDSLEGRIEFRGVSFDYPDGTPALKGVSFVIEPGTSLALVGPSGAGKSTIADLMLRFYDPSEGQILLDGVDYRELNIEWLRGQFGVVPQQTFLFAGSIAENLRLGQADASDEKIREAAAAANALVFIEKTEEGFETVLGERGARLSGGEGQRLAIARALVRDPRILLLDEATSALDAHSEKVVTEALEKAMVSRTTLFIAHRLTTAARATQILMLRSGEVLEQGSHEDLVAANGPYAAMYKTFAAGLLSEV